MKYFHCPTTFSRKAYGCGFGPVNATVAFLDLNQRCPRCRKGLKKWRKPTQAVKRAEAQEGVDTVRELFGNKAADSYAAVKGIE